MNWRQSVIKALTIAAEKLDPSGEKQLEKSEKKSEKKKDTKVWVEVTTQPEKKGKKYVGHASFHWKKDRDEKRQSEIISLNSPAKLQIKSKRLWVKPKEGKPYYYGEEEKPEKKPKVEPGKDYEKFAGKKLTLQDILDAGSSFKEAIGNLQPSKTPPPEVNPADVQIDLTGDVHSKTLAKWPQPTKKNPNKVQYAFTAEALERNAAKKWERVKDLQPKFDGAKEALLPLFQDENRTEKQRDAAAALLIIAETGLRPGNESDFKLTGNQGVTTLLADSVKVDGDNIKLKFIGKNNKENTRDFNNPELAAYLKKKLEGKKGSDRVFNATDKDLSKHGMKEIGLDGFKSKDFRTLLACRKAAEELAAQEAPPPPLPESAKEAKKLLKKVVKDTSEKVADFLGNTPAMAKKSYISPAIFEAYVTRVGGDPKTLLASVTESVSLLVAKEKPPSADEIWKQALDIELPEADEEFKAEDEDDEQLESAPLPEELQDEDMTEEEKKEVAAALRAAAAALDPGSVVEARKPSDDFLSEMDDAIASAVRSTGKNAAERGEKLLDLVSKLDSGKSKLGRSVPMLERAIEMSKRGRKSDKASVLMQDVALQVQKSIDRASRQGNLALKASALSARVFKGDKYTWYVYDSERATNITTKNKKHTVKLERGSAFGVRPATSKKGMMRIVVPEKGASRVFSYDTKFVDRLVAKSKRKQGRKPLG